MADPTPRIGVVAVVAMVLCCALPAVFVLAGGLLATALGEAVRFWPVTIAGVALVSLGGVSLARRVRSASSAPSKSY